MERKPSGGATPVTIFATSAIGFNKRQVQKVVQNFDNDSPIEVTSQTLTEEEECLSYYSLTKIVTVKETSIFYCPDENISLLREQLTLQQIKMFTNGQVVYSVTRLGDLLDFGQVFKAFGNK